MKYSKKVVLCLLFVKTAQKATIAFAPSGPMSLEWMSSSLAALTMSCLDGQQRWAAWSLMEGKNDSAKTIVDSRVLLFAAMPVVPL